MVCMVHVYTHTRVSDQTYKYTGQWIHQPHLIDITKMSKIHMFFLGEWPIIFVCPFSVGFGVFAVATNHVTLPFLKRWPVEWKRLLANKSLADIFNALGMCNRHLRPTNDSLCNPCMAFNLNSLGSLLTSFDVF